MRQIFISLLFVSLGTSVAHAEKLCLKVAFDKRTSKVSTTSTVADACPRGFTTLADTSKFKGAKGDTGATGAQGAKGDTGADGSVAVYGDGSDGNLIVSSPTTLTKGDYQFNNVTINATLEVKSGTVIRCTGSFTNNSQISIRPESNNGYRMGSSTSADFAFSPPEPGIALRTPLTGEIGTGSVNRGYPGDSYSGYSGNNGVGRLVKLRRGGSGGAGGFVSGGLAAGGAAGGFLTVYAQGAITNSSAATIDSEPDLGNSVSYGGGGGGGGVVILASQTSVSNAGLISMPGGTGGPSSAECHAGGGGGGGIIHLLAPSVTAGTTNVTGGAAGSSSTAVTASFHSGGGGGGASDGNGGYGGSDALSATGGSDGRVVTSSVDPTTLLF